MYVAGATFSVAVSVAPLGGRVAVTAYRPHNTNTNTNHRHVIAIVSTITRPRLPMLTTADALREKTCDDEMPCSRITAYIIFMYVCMHACTQECLSV